MPKKISSKEKRIRKKQSMRNRIFGTEEKPRLVVSRSLQHIYAQIINDVQKNTIVASSTLDKDIIDQMEGKTKKEKALLVGENLAKKAIEKGINTIVFDRNAYIYHGRIEALASGARNGGLKF